MSTAAAVLFSSRQAERWIILDSSARFALTSSGRSRVFIDCSIPGIRRRPLSIRSSSHWKLCWRVNCREGTTESQIGNEAEASAATTTAGDNLVGGAKTSSGTVVGAASLIIGTSIGSGILALPHKTSPAGFIPSAASMIICWAFLLVEALLLAEVNVSLRLKRRSKNNNQRNKGGVGEEGDDVISFKTMAHETLGAWGGNLATFTYVFLAYSSMVAYASKSGELLSHLITTLPSPILGSVFTALLSSIILFGGTNLTDHVNQFLTALMIVLLVAIEVIAASLGGWSGLMATDDWRSIPPTIPVIIFSLVYHDIAPVICSYLDGDMDRIRSSVVLGSLVPLLSLLVWDAIMLGFSPQPNGIEDPLDLLLSGGSWNGAWPMVEAFSLLAVGTSLIGTLLGFSQFFLEQLNNLRRRQPPPQQQGGERRRQLDGSSRAVCLGDGSKLLNSTAIAIAVVPPLLVSTTLPDAFSMATDIAGGYCMTTLYGILPPAMAWAMHERSGDDDHEDQNDLSKAKPALIGLGLFATGLVLEQVLQDLSMYFHL